MHALHLQSYIHQMYQYTDSELTSKSIPASSHTVICEF